MLRFAVWSLIVVWILLCDWHGNMLGFQLSLCALYRLRAGKKHPVLWYHYRLRAQIISVTAAAFLTVLVISHFVHFLKI